MSEDISTFSIEVTDEGDIGSAEWIILDRFNLGVDSKFIGEIEIYLSVEFLVSTSLVTNRDATGTVTTCLARLTIRKRLVWLARCKFIERVPSHLS
ncbi:MAG: hypothetical protein ACD_78C00365G0001, partial [uncultured bacterium (gcode 4)]